MEILSSIFIVFIIRNKKTKLCGLFFKLLYLNYFLDLVEAFLVEFDLVEQDLEDEQVDLEDEALEFP